MFFTFIAFRVRDLDEMSYSMQKYIFWDFEITQTLTVLEFNKLPIFLMAVFFTLQYISYKKNNMIEIISSLKLRYWFLFLVAIIFPILILYGGDSLEFIYFQF